MLIFFVGFLHLNIRICVAVAVISKFESVLLLSFVIVVVFTIAFAIVIVVIILLILCILQKFTRPLSMRVRQARTRRMLRDPSAGLGSCVKGAPLWADAHSGSGGQGHARAFSRCRPSAVPEVETSGNNTVPKEKLGPRLMQHIKGEAELVCEAIPVEKLCAEGGNKRIFELLDDKYGPQPSDLLHRALKDF